MIRFAKAVSQAMTNILQSSTTPPNQNPASGQPPLQASTHNNNPASCQPPLPHNNNGPPLAFGNLGSNNGARPPTNPNTANAVGIHGATQALMLASHQHSLATAASPQDSDNTNGDMDSILQAMTAAGIVLPEATQRALRSIIMSQEDISKITVGLRHCSTGLDSRRHHPYTLPTHSAMR